MNTNEIKIIGVGATGNQVLERIPFGSIKNTDCIVCDIDSMNLEKSSVQYKILLGKGIVKSSSIESMVEIGINSVLNSELDLAMNSAIDSFDQLDSLFDKSSKMVILVARLGDTTEAGIIPVIAQIAKKRGLFVVAIVYTPFDFEGEMKKKIADKGLKKLGDDCDCILVIKHSKIGKIYGNLGFKSSFGKADDIVIRLAKILLPLGSINADWLDLKIFFKKNQGIKPFFIGIAEGDGNDRAKNAIELAVKNTFSERDVFAGVSNVLLQINFGSIKITTDEMGQINDLVLNILEKEGSVTMSVSEDILLGDALSVIIIAY
jgi:cell division protein FtsZ